MSYVISSYVENKFSVIPTQTYLPIGEIMVEPLTFTFHLTRTLCTFQSAFLYFR